MYSSNAFIQAGIDATFHARLAALGGSTSTEFNFQPTEGLAQEEKDQLVQVRFNTKRGPRDFRGLRLATVSGGTWTWLTSRADSFPELVAQPDEPALRCIARALVGGAPLLMAQQGHRLAAVAVDFADIEVSPRECILRGIERFSGQIDEREALLGLAERLGLPTQATGDFLQLHDGTTARFDGNRIVALNGPTWGMSARHVLSDAHYTAVEHQMFLEGRFPNLAVEADLAHSAAVVRSDAGSLTVPAHLIATITAEEFTWAWDDPTVAEAPGAQASANLRRFGYDNALPDLVRPSMPLDWAKQAHLPQLAMPIMGLWTLLIAELSPTKVGLLLSDAPPFRLPAATPESAAATLAIPLPEGLNEKRARASYASFRGLGSLPEP